MNLSIKLFNSVSKNKEIFIPLDSNKVRMYVCGPTVYERPHLGNALSIVIYDMLYRLLIKVYGKERVLYVRNITDVDDKINNAAKLRNISIDELTTEITECFHQDMSDLNCLNPTIEPRATKHIKEMIEIIKLLIDQEYAYVSDNHVYFNVHKYADYGKMAGRNLSDLKAGIRIDIADSKHSPDDFVLWKPATKETDQSAIFESPWGDGRPGWHIECSAMSSKYLGNDFDIHGGGVDLIFPHHTNEIAQSCAAYPGSNFANFWVHNGFLTVNGEKMSKSLGNFLTVKDLIDKGIKGEVIRYLLLASHYRKPMDWNEKAILDAAKAIDSFYRIYQKFSHIKIDHNDIHFDFLESLLDDLNTPQALAHLHSYVKEINKSEGEEQIKYVKKLLAATQFMGFLMQDPVNWFLTEPARLTNEEIDNLIKLRLIAKNEKNWAESDRIRAYLKEHQILLEDNNDGTTSWRYG